MVAWTNSELTEPRGGDKSNTDINDETYNVFATAKGKYIQLLASSVSTTPGYR